MAKDDKGRWMSNKMVVRLKRLRIFALSFIALGIWGYNRLFKYSKTKNPTLTYILASLVIFGLIVGPIMAITITIILKAYRPEEPMVLGIDIWQQLGLKSNGDTDEDKDVGMIGRGLNYIVIAISGYILLNYLSKSGLNVLGSNYILDPFHFIWGGNKLYSALGGGKDFVNIEGVELEPDDAKIHNIGNSLARGFYYLIRAFLLITNGVLSAFSTFGYWLIGYKRGAEMEKEGGLMNFIRKEILGTSLDTNMIDAFWNKGLVDYGNSSLWLTYVFSFFVYFFMPNVIPWVLLLGTLYAYLKYNQGWTTMMLPGLAPVDLTTSNL